MLQVNQLTISLKETQKKLVHDVSFELKKGEVLAIIGESGSGKTLTSLAIMGLLNPQTFQASGAVAYGDDNLLDLSEKEIAAYRLSDIAMIYQEPMSSFSPFLTLGKQIHLALSAHSDLSKKQTDQQIKPFFEKVGLTSDDTFLNKYPHELSGGQLQRVMIAISLVLHPKILIADEPTTALDVYTQKEIMMLLKTIAQDEKLSVLFISHDLNLVKDIANRVLILKNGEIIEQNKTQIIFESPEKAYTKELLNSRISQLIEESRVSMS